MIEIKKLQGDITLVTEPMPEMGSAAVGIWVHTGAVNETEDIAGISHFIEHMMFKGTEKRTAAEVAEDMDRIGGQMNAFTGKEVTCYYIKTLASNLAEGLEILLDMFTNSVFDPEEMEREKRVIYEEMKMIKDTPDEDAHDTIGELLFRNAPYGHSIIGTEETVGPISRDTLTNYLSAQYTRDSIVVAVAGKFDEAEVAALVEGRLSHLRAGKERPQLASEPIAPAFRVKTRDIEQTHLCLATRAVRLDDPRYYAFHLLTGILGGSMSSRLFQNVRERKGLAYSVYASLNPFAEDGYFNIYAGVGHDKIAEATAAIKEELALLAEKGVTDGELHKAKEQTKSGFIFGQESVNGRMVGLGRMVSLTGRAREQDEVLASIDAVSEEDVRGAVATISDIGTYSAVAVTHRDMDLAAIVQGA